MHTAQQHSAETARLHYQINVSLLINIVLDVLNVFNLLTAYGGESNASRRISSWALRWDGPTAVCDSSWHRAPRFIHSWEVAHRLVSFKTCIFFIYSCCINWLYTLYRSSAELKWLVRWGKAWKRSYPTSQYNWRACLRAIEDDPLVKQLFLPEHLLDKALLCEAHKRCVAKMKH